MKFKNKILCLTLAIALLFVSMPSVSAVEVDDVSNVLSEDNEITQENNSIKQNADQPEIASTEETEIDVEFVYEWDDDLTSSETSKNDTAQATRSTQITTTGYIPDGVYSLRNVANQNFWMDVQNDSLYADSYIQQTAYSSNPADTFTRPALFKISRIPNTNRYVIRLMTNNRLTFFVNSDNEAKTVEIPPNDSNVPSSKTFYITYDSNGYVIQPCSSSDLILGAQNTTSEGESAYPYSKLKFYLNHSSNTKARWQLYKYTGTEQCGILTARTVGMADGIPVGQSGSLWIYTWSTAVGANTPYMFVDPNYTNVGQIAWDGTRFGSTVTGLAAGDLKIKLQILYDGTQTALYNAVSSQVVIPDIVGDTAYVQNVATGKYMEVESASTANGGIVQQWSFHTGTQAQWIFELGGGGFFKIKNVNSGKYLGVDSSDTTKVKQYSSATNYTLWKISETSSGNYKFACKALESSGKVLCAPATTSGNGVDLTMLVYGDNSSYTDEWKIGVFVATLNIKLYADKAYQDRFSNYSSKLSSSMMTIREKYLFDFQILIKYSSIDSITSWGDYCDELSGGNYASDCPHGDNDSSNNASDGLCVNSSFSSTGNANQDLHHKNIYNIVYRIPFPNISQNTLMIFSGHNYCQMSGGNHYGRANGLSWSASGFNFITNFSSDLSERKTILHEIGHWYGVPDHYSASVDPNSSYSDYCIYGTQRESPTVLNNLTICEGCQAVIRANASKFQH